MSGARGTVRKYFDVGPTSVSASSVYSGGATGYSVGIADWNSNVNYWLPLSQTAPVTTNESDSQLLSRLSTLESRLAAIQLHSTKPSV